MQRNTIGLLVLIVLITGVGIYGWLAYNRKVEPIKNDLPAFTVSAEEIISEFETNDSIPTNKYLGKLIQVSGITKQVDKDDQGFYTVVLGDTSSMSSVRCAMDSVFASAVNTLQQGQVTGVKGIFTGYQKDDTGLLGSDIILNRCVIELKQSR